jgi:hypothetical protein
MRGREKRVGGGGRNRMDIKKEMGKEQTKVLKNIRNPFVGITGGLRVDVKKI